MIRYLRQHDSYRCGPIALMNLHKWQGLSATRADLHRYVKLCECTKSRGTSRRNFSRAVGKRSKRVTYLEFKKIIGRGSAVLLMRRPYRDGHFWFCPSTATRTCDNKKGFLGVNFWSHGAVGLISWQYMASILRYCVIWSFE